MGSWLAICRDLCRIILVSSRSRRHPAYLDRVVPAVAGSATAFDHDRPRQTDAKRTRTAIGNSRSASSHSATKNARIKTRGRTNKATATSMRMIKSPTRPLPPPSAHERSTLRKSRARGRHGCHRRRTDQRRPSGPVTRPHMTSMVSISRKSWPPRHQHRGRLPSGSTASIYRHPGMQAGTGILTPTPADG